jgi:hypothetical protein
LRSNERFDFDLLAERVTSFHQDDEPVAKNRGRASTGGGRLAAARA